MIPYGKHEITEKDVERVVEALRSEKITQGNHVDRFEDQLAEYFGTKEAVTIANGTLALYLAYKSLGLTEGDKIITTPITFVATANAACLLGAKPVLVDIDPETYNLSPTHLKNYLDESKSKNLKGISTVHFGGHPCRMDKIKNIANKHDLFVVEDACHSPGANWDDQSGNTHKIGNCSHSDAVVLSLHPVKHFTSGEGGVVLTNDKKLAQDIKQLRHHGIVRNPETNKGPEKPWLYDMKKLGINGRLTDIQSALGISQLERLDKNIKKRQRKAKKYSESFHDIPEIQTPTTRDWAEHVYHLYVVRAQNRKELFERLKNHEISPQVHYIPIHYHTYYQERLDYEPGDLPNAESYYDEALTLPLYPTLSVEEQDRVINIVKEFYR